MLLRIIRVKNSLNIFKNINILKLFFNSYLEPSLKPHLCNNIPIFRVIVN